MVRHAALDTHTRRATAAGASVTAGCEQDAVVAEGEVIVGGGQGADEAQNQDASKAWR